MAGEKTTRGTRFRLEGGVTVPASASMLGAAPALDKDKDEDEDDEEDEEDKEEDEEVDDEQEEDDEEEDEWTRCRARV